MMDTPEERATEFKRLGLLQIKYCPSGVYPIEYLPYLPDSEFKYGAEGLTKKELLVYLQGFTTDPIALTNLRFEKLSYATTFYYYYTIGMRIINEKNEK